MKAAVPMRRMVLGAALLLTLGATAYGWIDDKKSDAADVVVAITGAQERAAIVPVSEIAKSGTDKLPERVLPEVDRDIFAVQRKEPEPELQKVAVPTVAPPPPPIIPQTLPAAPSQPVAPPLPFTYIGKLGENGKYTVFLSARGKNYAVKSGETVAQLYRIEEIRPPMMTMTYLPMSIKQTMQIGEMN